MLRAQSGDRDALTDLLEHARSVVQRGISAMCRDEAMAADVLQEVLILTYRRLATLREPRAFTAWLRRLAYREVLRTLRGERKHDHDELEDVEAPPAAEQALLRRLPDLLRHVSPASRGVLVLHYLDDLDLEAIALVLDIPLGTAKSRLAHGLRAVRKALEENAG